MKKEVDAEAEEDDDDDDKEDEEEETDDVETKDDEQCEKRQREEHKLESQRSLFKFMRNTLALCGLSLTNQPFNNFL